MNPEFSNHPKLREQQKLEAEQRQTLENAQKELAGQAEERQFGSVDELLRFDAEQHPVPPEIAERLNASIAAEGGGKREKGWFRRMFGS